MGTLLLFDISGGELIVILLFVLLFFGAKGIPDIARTLGRTLRQVRDAGQEVQREIQRGAHQVRREVEAGRAAVEGKVPEPPPGGDAPTESAP
jgi:sec-independent protein translocase protein TatA